jgi:hypothetical protein
MRMKGREQGLVELMDDSYKVREQIRLSDLHAYGYTYDIPWRLHCDSSSGRQGQAAYRHTVAG